MVGGETQGLLMNFIANTIPNVILPQCPDVEKYYKVLLFMSLRGVKVFNGVG
jgi:hypothetical protein